ncbi:MAG: hypothetical protein ACR2KK_01005, partial [Acidimicrobiales bacterium]
QLSDAAIGIGLSGVIAGGFFNLIAGGPDDLENEPWAVRARTWRILAPYMWRWGLIGIVLGGIGLGISSVVAG